MAVAKYVYRFGKGKAEGNKDQRELLGGKGANLAEMSAIGLPVPPGFTITTEACNYAITSEMQWPETMMDEVKAGIRYLEETMQVGFGDPENPLLVSVRSGAAVSMPGMMDTVLNLGMNDEVVRGLARRTGNERFAYDSYRRFIDMYGNVVMGIDHKHFEKVLDHLKASRKVREDTELDARDMYELTDRYKKVYRQHTGLAFPADPMEQLTFAINAVFKSWNSNRAVKYRQISGITGMKGTGVNVQAMVFGNMGDESGTGVCFTRNPSTGEPELYGEFLINAQGEDVVAGIRTPLDIRELENVMPKVYVELRRHAHKLERYYQNMQDIEFTVQEGVLYILQTRIGKRTGPASIRIAVDMVNEDLVDKRKALRDLVEPAHIDHLLHPQLSDKEIKPEDIIGRGLPASPGAAVGKVVFDPDVAEQEHARGKKVILVRTETSPEDVGGMSSAEGILTSRGGMTSHAAVVARGWGKPCIAGCKDIVIDYQHNSFTNGKVVVRAGEWISLDGTTGRVIRGKKSLVQPKPGQSYEQLMKWVSELEVMKVRANADTPEDAAHARSHGAVGIGLTRTEHMFFQEGRITAMRRMIVAGDEQQRREALEQLLPYQRRDFIGIFEAMEGLPVTIRLLDPPLHEFLPQEENEIRSAARELDVSADTLKAKLHQLREFNPMLGHRGCRLGIMYPEITEMQTRAILEAAIMLRKHGKPVMPEIMIPLIGTVEEFRHQRKVIDQTAQQVFDAEGMSIAYEVGTMIEIPRAALLADRIAEDADFFSFGTNDLTQMTYGYSRDDAVKFLPYYVEQGILSRDPFQVLDIEGVGQLVETGTKQGRMTKPELKVGICGEHGGDPESVEFFYRQGFDYVSCSPYRVPVARLASVQARLRAESDASFEERKSVRDRSQKAIAEK